jgi:hypothetical protein
MQTSAVFVDQKLHFRVMSVMEVLHLTHVRVEAILSFPPPKNQRQIRRFLGVCYYHHRFAMNYANYVAPLLPLLRKGNRWKWSTQTHQAFETFGSKFADSIHLIHADETLMDRPLPPLY